MSSSRSRHRKSFRPDVAPADGPERSTTAELTAAAQSEPLPTPEEIAATVAPDAQAAAAAAVAHQDLAPPTPEEIADEANDAVAHAEAVVDARAEAAQVETAAAETDAAGNSENVGEDGGEDAEALVFESEDSDELASLAAAVEAVSGEHFIAPVAAETSQDGAVDQPLLLTRTAELDAPAEAQAPANEAGEAGLPAPDASAASDENEGEDEMELDPSDALELEADGEVDAPAEVHAPVVATPANPDDEFLRRVVLPTPVPTITRPAGALPFEPMSLAESQDRTVISEPPSPEILAAMSAPVPVAAPVPALSASGAHPGLPLGWQDSGYSRPARRWQLSSMQLGGLLLAAAIGGAFIGGTLRPGTATEPALEAATVAPLTPVASVPTITPLPQPGAAATPPAQGQILPAAAMPTTSGPDIQPITRPVSVSKKTTSPIRRSASKRAPKKEFVDPFE